MVPAFLCFLPSHSVALYNISAKKAKTSVFWNEVWWSEEALRCRQFWRKMLKDFLNTYFHLINVHIYWPKTFFWPTILCDECLFRSGRSYMAFHVYELNSDFWLRCFCSLLCNFSSRIDFLMWRQYFKRASPISEHLPNPWLNHAFDGPLVKASHNDKPRVNVQGQYIGCKYRYGTRKRFCGGVFCSMVKWPQKKTQHKCFKTK